MRAKPTKVPAPTHTIDDYNSPIIVENSTENAIFSTNNSTNSPIFSTNTQSVETAKIPQNEPFVVELGVERELENIAKERAESTKRANKFAAYSQMGEEELSALSRADLQAYKNSENKKKAEYTKRNSPMLTSVKMRLATIDRALAKQRGEL